MAMSVSPQEAIPSKAETPIGLIVRNQEFCFGGTEEAELDMMLYTDEDFEKN
jgi:hypothetical protein